MAYCTLNLVDCSENDFDTIKDESGYVSYRFKSYKSYTAGMQYGLQILINLESIKCDRCYLDGLRVIIHNHSVDSGYYSGGTKAGLTLAPGLSHEVAVKRTFSSATVDNSFKKTKTSAKHKELADSTIDPDLDEI
jgi:hypothetical protein